MQVILKKTIAHLGKEGETITVSDGYGRNYLIPQGIAFEATSGNLKILEWEKNQVSLRRNKEIREAKDLAQSLKKLSITIRSEVGENEKLYGSVGVNDIITALANEGVHLSKKQIVLEEPIKALGIYNIPVKLHPEVESKIKIWVVKT
ncbi:50S ribosomal protein L9 [bacterium]|nr:50S ribosomal protein L9 [bacterium]